MTIKSRILLFTAVLVIGAMLAAGMMGYKMGSSSLEKGYAERLTQIRLNRAQALQADFESLGNYLLVASEMTRIREALKNLFSSEEELNAYIANQSETPWLKEVSDYHGTNLGEEVEHTIIPRLPKTSLFLQAQFLHQAKIKETEPRNIVNIKELENLKYFKAHSEIHPFFIDYADRFQISDVYLIDKSGRIIYSLNKGLNYGTNLNTGIFASTRLTDVFHWSLGAQPRTYKLFDFMPMAPFMPQQVAFMATPIFDNSSYLGVVVFQISLDRIDRIISDDHQWNKNGLRETGEVIAFGPDGLMRNNSRLYYEHPAEFENIVKKLGASGQILVNTKEAGTTAMQVATPPERIRHHLHSEDITEVGPDYLNVPVLRSIGKVHLPGGVDWVLISKMDTAETTGTWYRYMYALGIIAAIILLGALGGANFFSNRLIRPLRSLHFGFKKMSETNINEEINYQHNDEYREIFSDYNAMTERLASINEDRKNLLDVVNSLSDLLFIVDVQPGHDMTGDKLLLVNVNRTASDLIGLSDASLVGSDLLMWLETDLTDVLEFINIDIDPTVKKKQTEGFLKRTNGERVPLILTWTKNPSNRHRLILAGTDLRLKKENERELRLQENLLKASQSLSKTGSFVWEMDSGRQVWSEEFFNILGLDPLKTKPSFDLYRSLVHPEDLPLLDKALKDSQKSTNPFKVDFRIKRADSNDYIWVRASGEIEYDQYGNAVSTWGINQEITDVKKAEQELIAMKDEALKSSQAKSQFLAHMSHEIRTPMNAIMGMAELLKDTPLNEDQKYYLTIFQKAGDVLMALINDILDLSKIEAGEVSIENIPFDLRKMMTDVQEMMRPRALERGVDYSFEIGPGITPYLMGDPTKLRQVLINLVSNSIKFTERGQIKVTVVKNPTKKDSLMISISDSGVGIPANKQHLIFQKFSQADSSITRRYGGTGLGLAISKSLVELMGGQIWFKSRENVGTTFFFTMPIREQIYSTAAQKPIPMQASHLNFIPEKPVTPLTPRASNKKVRILLADDTEDNRILFTHYLKSGPFEIIEAENGLEAVDKIKSEEFDIVFMDVQMPEMDGYAATSVIRDWEKETNHSHIPIIALTAHALSDDRQKSLRAGCDDHVTKPFKKDVLLGVINRFSH